MDRLYNNVWFSHITSNDIGRRRQNVFLAEIEVPHIKANRRHMLFLFDVKESIYVTFVRPCHRRNLPGFSTL